MRLAARYALLYILLLSAVTGIFFYFSSLDIDEDVELSLTQELHELIGIFQQSGIESLRHKLQQRIATNELQNNIYLLVSAQHEVLAGNLQGWPAKNDIPLDKKPHHIWIEDDIIPVALREEDAYWPVIGAVLSDGSKLLVARNVGIDEELIALLEFTAEVLGVSVLLALLIAVTLAWGMRRRIAVIADTADAIMRGDLGQRIPVGDRSDEFDMLAVQLNAMLDRIQALVKGIRMTTDNVAHDLRSPLTRLRNRLDITLLENRSNEEYRQTIRQCIDDADSLVRTFNSLLSIAQAEAGNHRSNWQQVNLAELAVDVVDLYRAVAEEREQMLLLKYDEHVLIYGSRELLAQALGNLLENSIKYSPLGSEVEVSICRQGSIVEMSVVDTGPGIPKEEYQHVLQRFVRLEASRHTPGNGLGLSLVNAVASLHKGSLQFSEAKPGLRATLRLPVMESS
jgi:signal transduction histidine kinase